MAKIVCEYDSETKEMVVKVNGEVQEMADSFSCYVSNYEGEDENSVKYGSCYINFCCEEKDGVKIYKSAQAKKKLENYARELLNNKKSKNGV